MPRIRLNKAVKEFNISMSRLVEFLDSKGIEVESNPNAQLDDAAYNALKAEFAQDGEQRKASQEVVLSKVPEEKLEIEEKKTEVIRAKGNLKAETKILGKIDLSEKKEEILPEPEVKPEPVIEAKSEKQEPRILGKINLDEVPGKKAVEKKEEKVEPKEEAKAEVQPEIAKAAEPEISQPIKETKSEPESDKIETVYKKLEGPKILKEKVDLTQFQDKSKSSGAKKKRKRIEKPAGNQQQGNQQQNNGNRPPQGNRPPNQGGNRPNNNNNKKGGSRRGSDRVMLLNLLMNK